MANPRRKGYLKQHEKQGKSVYLVGAKDPTDNYVGPVAEVTWDDAWLHIVTDSCEGYVMLNIEALPHLRRALAAIARKLRGQVK